MKLEEMIDKIKEGYYVTVNYEDSGQMYKLRNKIDGIKFIEIYLRSAGYEDNFYSENFSSSSKETRTIFINYSDLQDIDKGYIFKKSDIKPSYKIQMSDEKEYFIEKNREGDLIATCGYYSPMGVSNKDTYFSNLGKDTSYSWFNLQTLDDDLTRKNDKDNKAMKIFEHIEYNQVYIAGKGYDSEDILLWERR